MISWGKILFFFPFFFIFFLGLDQVSKSWARGISKSDKDGLFSIYTTYNTEGVFGLFPAVPPLGPIILAALFVAILIISTREDINIFALLALALFLAGIVGNSLDRLFYDKVTDWIYVHPGFILNFADLAIFFGMVFSILFLYQKRDSVN